MGGGWFPNSPFRGLGGLPPLQFKKSWRGWVVGKGGGDRKTLYKRPLLFWKCWDQTCMEMILFYDLITVVLHIISDKQHQNRCNIYTKQKPLEPHIFFNFGFFIIKPTTLLILKHLLYPKSAPIKPNQSPPATTPTAMRRALRPQWGGRCSRW